LETTGRPDTHQLQAQIVSRIESGSSCTYNQVRSRIAD
jgi:hypothetical protein